MEADDGDPQRNLQGNKEGRRLRGRHSHKRQNIL